MDHDEYDEEEREMRDSLELELDDECYQASKHVDNARRVALQLKVSRRAIKRLQDISHELCGFNLWLLDFGRNESKKIKSVPEQHSVQELEEYATELALQIEHWANGGEDLEVKLKDYLGGATVLFDAAGNVVDGCLQVDYSPWVISPRGVEVSFTWSDLSNKKFVGVGFTKDTSRKILDLLTQLHKAGRITCPHGNSDDEDD